MNLRYTILMFSIATTVLVSRTAYSQQRTQYTQYMFNGIVINPAYAGADEALSLTFIHRSQWVGMQNAPTTQTLAAHTLFKHQHMGIGGTIVRDRIGVHSNLNAVLNYAYHLRVAEQSVFSMGLYAGMRNRRSDYTTLSGNVLNDPSMGNPTVNYTTMDIGAGFYYRTPRFHAGVSAPGLIPERIKLSDSLTVQPTKTNLFIFSKMRFQTGMYSEIEPAVLVKYMQGTPISFDVNLNWVYRRVLTAGVSYRKKESFDLLLKAQLTTQLQFGYSYDYPLGAIAQIGNGSHEVMVNYLFKYRHENIKSPR